MALKSNEWHLRDPEAVSSVLDTDMYRGLEVREVRRRIRRNGKNKIWQISHTSATEYALRSLGDLTSLVLVIASLTAAIFEQSRIALSVCSVLVLGIIFRVVTYVKARHVLEKIADEGIPSATVIRGGVSSVVRADEIVVGDILILGAGDIVPCDGRIVDGDEIRVSEQGITENKTSVIKGDTIILQDKSVAEIPCEYRVNMMFAGSTVLSGSCRIVATACGEDTLVSMRRGGIVIPSGEDAPVVAKLNDWCRKGSVLTLLCVLVLSGLSVVLHLFRGTQFSLTEAFIDAMALAASSVSSYLVTVGFVTLSIPLRRLSERKSGKTVVKDISKIEEIADISTVIVADVSAFKSGRASYSSYFADGEFKEVRLGDKRAGKILYRVMRTFAGKSADSSLAGEGSVAVRDSELLIRKVAESAKNEFGLDVAQFEKGEAHPIDYKCDGEGKDEVHNVILRRGTEYEIHISGGIRKVLMCCDFIKKNGREVKMTDDDRREILRAAFGIEERGGNVIALAHRKSIYTSLKRLSVLRSNMCFDGFVSAEEGFSAEAVRSAGNIKQSEMSVILLSSRPELDRGYLAKGGFVEPKVPILNCKDILEGCDIPYGSFVVLVPPRGETGGKIDAAAKIRMATVKKISEARVGVAVITDEPSEAGMISDGSIGSAVSRSHMRPIPQTLKRRAEISAYPADELGYGGFGNTVSAVSAASGALENLRGIAQYTVASQLARLMCVLLSIVCDISFLNAVGILILGMIFDFSAVLVMSFSPQNDDKIKCSAEKRRLPSGKNVISVAVFGAVSGIISFTAVILGAYFADVNIKGVGNGMMIASVVSLLLIQLVILSEVLLDSGKLLQNVKANRAYFLYAVATFITVLLLMFSKGFSSHLGDVCPHWTVNTVAASSSLIVLMIYEIKKYLKPKNK